MAKERGRGGEVASISVQEFEDFESSYVLVAFASSKVDDEEWILDSRWSFHMFPHKEWFLDLKEEHRTILLGDSKACQIFGSGSINLKFAYGCNRKLRNVRYVSNLKRNLTSVGALDVCGYSVKIKKGIIKVIKGSMTIMKGHLRNG